MVNHKPFLLLLPLMALLLCGCPWRSPWQLDAAPQLPADETLVGKWAAFVQKTRSGKAEPVKVIISAHTNTEYNIYITGYLDELRMFRGFNTDTIKGTGFLSAVGNHQVLNVHIQQDVYLCEVAWEKGKLSLLPLSEHFTQKMIKSNTVLRQALEFHYKTRLRPVYENEFCLLNMVRVN